MPIDIESLRTYLNAHPGGIVTDHQMLIARSKWGIFTHATYHGLIPDTISEEGYYEMTIDTEGDSEWDFIEGFKLESLEKITQLSAQHSWMRYLNGQAEITLSLIPFEFDLSFRICNYKTMIYCARLHFYDEVYTHLTVTEDFEAYVNERLDFLMGFYNR